VINLLNFFLVTRARAHVYVRSIW